MTRWLNPRLCLSSTCSFLLAWTTCAQSLQQSVAITLDSGQSTVESFQLTVPVVAQTMTQVSMVTVTQVSMQTSTIMSMVTQMQTITVPGTCAATQQAVTPQSSLAVVTAGALNQVDTTASPVSTVSSSSAVPGTSGASTASVASPAASGASSEPCDCSCLCPAAAFQMAASVMAANTSLAALPSSVQMSTFQTIASASTANKVAASYSSGSVQSSSAAGASSTTSLVTTESAATATSKSGILPSVIVTDPGTPTVKAQIQNSQDAPFNINTYQLMKSVGLPVVVGRGVEPSVAV